MLRVASANRILSILSASTSRGSFMLGARKRRRSVYFRHVFEREMQELPHGHPRLQTGTLLKKRERDADGGD